MKVLKFNHVAGWVGTLGSAPAFTLSEVLITLGIIGIVAALTMPSLIQNHKKHVIETRLLKFYSTMNQAVKLSVIDNSETRNWIFPDYYAGQTSPEEVEEFYNKYFKKYINTAKTDIINFDDSRLFVIYFLDGSSARLGWQGHDWHYFPNAKEMIDNIEDIDGRNYWAFGFYPTTSEHAYTIAHYYNKGIEPYIPHYIKDEDGKILYKTDDSKLYEAKAYTAIIQRNSWKIPEDYPFKF